MKAPKLTKPQLWLLRKIVANGLNYTHIVGSSAHRVANTLAVYELITLYDDGNLALPTNNGRAVAERGGRL